jgi:ribokinase
VTPGRVVVVGSVNVDLVVVASRLPGPGQTVTGGDVARHHGGKGGNQAVAAARLGADVAFVGAVGDDDFGVAARAALVTEGIDVTHLLVAPRPTGVALIVVDEQAENLIAVAPGANAAPTPASVTAALLALAIGPGDVVLVSCEIPPEAIRAALAAARAAGATSVLNPAPADRLDPATIVLADVLTPNEGELALLAGGVTGRPGAGADAGAATADAGAATADAGAATTDEQPAATAGAADVEVLARRLLARDAGRAVVVTLGAAGALAVPADGQALAIPALNVVPVDTTGAGDAFNGALAAGLGAGLPLNAAARQAVAAAGLSTMRPGARGGMPTAAELAAVSGR